MVLRPLTLIGIILSIVTGTALGVLVYLKTKDTTPIPTATALTDALRQVSDNYVRELSDEELLSHAIEGMMRSLDAHSAYLDPGAFEALQANTTGRFGGIGIELGLVEGYFTVIAPIDDTPAKAAGIIAGDRITEVDGEPTEDLQLVELVQLLRGVPGSEVTLTIKRKDVEPTIDFGIERDVVHVASVRERLLEPGYGYIRIAQFQTSTSKDVAKAIERLNDEYTAPLEGLVLDLRNNPGGTLQSSVEVADHFIERGLIVFTEGRLQSAHAKYRATRGDLLNGMPIVVLINGGSASASEIVAGALKDHNRAKLMGSTSFGKGSVQSVLPLDDNRALKLTTAHYFTPNGQSIHEIGIAPDIEFDGDEASLLDEALQLLKRENNAATRQARL